MKNNFKVLAKLIQRGLKIFLSDRMGVFLALLAPIIILFLYIMFLGEIQVDTLNGYLEGLSVSGKLVRAFVDSWMLAGVLAVSCITVSFCAQTVMIGDRERGTVADMLTSPINRNLLSLSYLFVNAVITFVIVMIVEVIAFIYLAIAGWSMSAGDVFKLFGLTALSVVSASLFTTAVSMFIKTQSAHGGASGILSAAIGFFIGAYMPISMFPKAIQYIILFIPGSYSACAFRNVLMDGAMEKLLQGVPAVAHSAVEQKIMSGYSMTMDAFGKDIGAKEAWIIFAAATLLLVIVYALISIVKGKRGTLFCAPDFKRLAKRSKQRRF